MSSYTTDVPAMHRPHEYTTPRIKLTKVVDRPKQTSLLVKNINAKAPSINNRILRLLHSIAKLDENWDEQGGIAPSKDVIDDVYLLIGYLDRVAQKVYNIAPGPDGEIMIDIRNGSKSVEILYYPQKKKFVKFEDDQKPQQGLFEIELLPKLISWVNV